MCLGEKVEDKVFSMKKAQAFFEKLWVDMVRNNLEEVGERL